MKPLDTPVRRATVGAGLLLICGLVGRGVLPEPGAAPPEPVIDPGGNGIVVATTNGDETVTIYGVELSGIVGWNADLLSASADFGLPTEAAAEASRSGALEAAGRGAMPAWYHAPAALPAGLEPGDDRPDTRPFPDVRPLMAALIDPQRRHEPAATDDLPPGLPPVGGPIVAALPWTAAPDALDTPLPERDRLSVPVAAFDPIAREPGLLAEAPTKRGADGWTGGPAGTPFKSPVGAGSPIAGALPGRSGGSPFGGSMPSGGGGGGPGDSLDDPITELFDGPDPIAHLPGGHLPPPDWGPGLFPPGALPAAVVPQAVPEPDSLLLTALALLGLGALTRRGARRRVGH